MPRASSPSTTAPQSTRTPPPSSNSNLARIRDNQRRSRARRKEYLNELEDKFRKCEQLGVEATSEMQVAARKVLEENNRLRAFLREKGIDDDELDAWMDGAEGASREGSVSAGMYGGSRSPAPDLAGMIGTRRKCCPREECDDEEMEESKPSLAMLAPRLGTTSQAGSVNGSIKTTPIPTPTQLFPRPIAQGETPVQSAINQYHSTATPGLAQNTAQELHLPNYDSYQAQVSQFQQYLQQQQQQQQHHPHSQAYQPQQYQPQSQLAPSQQQLAPMQQHYNNHLQPLIPSTSTQLSNNNMPIPSMSYYNLPDPDAIVPATDYYNTLAPIDPALNFDTALDMDTTSSLLLPSDMQAQFLRGLSSSSSPGGGVMHNNNHNNTSYQ